MSEHYSNAAARHLDDALLLYEHRRFDNAAYLAGYVAECAMKTILETSSMTPRRLGHDLRTTSIEALELLWIVSPAMRRYGFAEAFDLDGLLSEWRPEARYEASGSMDSDRVQKWLDQAQALYQRLVVAAVLDGWSDLR